MRKIVNSRSFKLGHAHWHASNQTSWHWTYSLELERFETVNYVAWPVHSSCQRLPSFVCRGVRFDETQEGLAWTQQLTQFSCAFFMFPALFTVSDTGVDQSWSLILDKTSIGVKDSGIRAYMKWLHFQICQSIILQTHNVVIPIAHHSESTIHALSVLTSEGGRHINAFWVIAESSSLV